MATSSPSVTGMTVFVRVCPQGEHSSTGSRRASAVLDKKGSFASSFSLKNSFVSSKSRNSSLLPGNNSDRCIVTPDDRTIRVLKSGAAAREGDKEYTFDKVFPEESSQEELCINVHDHVLEVVSGFNVTIICHGASKSGKSFTMTGTKEARGIIPHAVRSVFAHIDKIRLQEPDLYFYAEVGYVELYNNAFRDLLYNSGGSASLGSGREDGDDDSVVLINEPSDLDSMFDNNSVTASGKKSARNSHSGSIGAKSTADDHKIQVHESKNLGVFLAGSPTLRVAVSSAQDVFQLYSSGQKVRSSRVTDAGHISSRSHAILILYLESRAFTGDTAALNGSPGTSPERPHAHSAGLRMSKLTFVDMAGADRLEISGAVGDTLVESQNINLSLNAFGDVLFALSKNAKVKQGSGSKGMQHVPYLNSKLTQLLKESLGGNTKTVMITTIHATTDYSKVTETSLQYASWARAVRGKVVRNDLNMADRWIAETDPEILRLKKLLEERSRDFARLRVTQLNRPPLAPQSSTNGSSAPSSAAPSPAGSRSSSPLRVLQKRPSEPSQMAVPESKSSGPDHSALKNRISDLELTNQELKEDVARKSRQSADLSMSLKKSLELIQQQNKALTDQLNDVANDKDAQIAVLNDRLAGLQAELDAQRMTSAGDADDALNATNAELERAKKSAWDRYLTITQQQEQITTLEQSLQLEVSKREKLTHDADQKLHGHLAESQASIEEQKRVLDQERANLHAALKAAEDHVYEQEVHLQEQHASQAYQINTLNDKCEALRAELEAKDAELAKARAQAKESQEKLVRESRLLTSESAKASDLQASLDMHIALVSSLKLKMATLQGHMTEETTKRVDRDGRVAELEKEVAALRNELDRIHQDHETHSNDLTGMLQDSSAELQNLVDLVGTKESAIKALEARVAGLQETNAADKQASQQQVLVLEAQLREQVESHQQLSSKYLQRNSEAETFDTNHRTVRTQLEELTVEIATLKKKLTVQEDVLTKEKSTTGELNQALTKAHKLHEASVNQFTDELLDLNVKLQTSNNLATELNRTISDYERQIEALRARLDDTIAISEADAVVAHEQITALEAQLAEKQAALSREAERGRELESQRKAMRDEVSSRETEKKQLLRQIKDLEEKLTAEMQKRKSEVDAAHELRKEALGASKADLEQYIVISEEKVASLERDLAAAEQKFEEVTALLNDKIQDGLLAHRELSLETTLQLQGKDAEISSLEQQLLKSEAERAAQELAAQNVVAVFQAELVKVRADVQKLQERSLDLESENHVIRTAIDEKETQFSDLQQRSQLKIADLQSALDTQTALVASLRLKLDIVQGGLEEESETRQNRERRVAELEALNCEMEAAAARQLKKLEGEVEHLTARCEEFEAKIRQLEPLIPERDVKIEQIEGALRRAESDARDKAERIRDAEAKIRDLQQTRDQLAVILAEKSAELDTVVELGQSQRKTLELQAREAAVLKSTVAALEQRIEAEVSERSSESAVYEQQIAALKDEVAEGVDALKRAQAERAEAIADLEDRMEEYSMNVEELQNALNIKEASIAMLKDKLVVQEQRVVAETNARIAAAAAAEHIATDLREQIADQNARLKAAVDSHNSDVKALKQQLSDKQRAFDDLASTLAATDAALKATEVKLVGQIQRGVEEAQARKMAVDALNNQIDTLESEKASLTAALAVAEEELSTTVADLTEQVISLRAKLEEQTRALAIAENQLKLSEDKLLVQEQRTVAEVNARRAEAAAFDEQIAELENQISELEERLSAAVDNHGKEVHAMVAKLEERKRTAAELAEELAASRAALRSTQDSLNALEHFSKVEGDRHLEEVSALEKQVADLDLLCTDLQKEVSDLEKRLAAATLAHSSEYSDLQSQLQAQLDGAAELSTELAATRASLQSTEEQLVAQQQLTEEEVASHEADNAGFAEQLAALEARLAELHDTLEKTRRMHHMSVADLEEENQAAEARCEELSDEIAELYAELDGLRTKNADLQAELDYSVPRQEHEVIVDGLREELDAAEELRAGQEAAGLAALRTAQAELAELAAVELTLKNEIVEINEDRKKALDAFRTRVEELEAELNLRQAEIARLTELLQDRDADIQVLQDKLNEAEYVAKIEAEGARSMLDSADNQRKSLAEAREVLQHRHRQALDDLADARAETSHVRAELDAKSADAERLEARLAEKQAQLVVEVNARAADAADFEERLDALRATVADLEDALRTARNECDSIAAVLHTKDIELSRAVKEHAKQVAVRDTVIDKVQNQLAEAEVLSSELQADVAQLQAVASHLTSSNKRLAKEVEESLAVADAARSHAVGLEKKLAESVNMRTAEKEAHRAEIEILEAARAVAAIELEAALAQADKISDDLRDALLNLEDENARHAHAEEQQDEMIASLNARLADKEIQIENLSLLADELEAANAALQILANDRALEVKAAEDRLAEMEQLLAEKDAEIDLLKKQVLAAQQAANELRASLEDAAVRAAELESQLEEAAAAKELLKGECRRLDCEAAIAQQRADVLQTTLEEQVALVEALKVKLVAQEDAHNADKSAKLAEINGLKQLLVDAQDETAEVQDALQKAEKALANAERELKQAQAKNESLRRELEACTAKAKAASEALGASELVVDDLSSMLADSEAARQAAVAAVQEKTSECATLQSRVDDLKAMLADLQATMQDRLVELSAAKSAEAALAAALKIAEAELADHQSEIKRLTAEAEALAEESDERARENVAAQDRYDELQAMYGEQWALVEALKVKLVSQDRVHLAEHGANQAEIAGLKQMLNELQDTRADLADALAAAKEKVPSLEKQLVDLEALRAEQVGVLQKAVVESGRDLAEMATALAVSEDEARDLKSSNNDLFAENQALAVAAQDRLEELNAARDRLSDAVQQLLDLKAEADSRKALLAAEVEKAAVVQEDLHASQDEVVALQRRLQESEAARVALAAQIEKHAAEISAAADRIDELQALFEDQAALAETLKIKLASQEEAHAGENEQRCAEVAALKARVAELQQAMFEAQDTIVNLAQQRRESEGAVADLDKQVQDDAQKYNALKEQLDAKNKECDSLRGKLHDTVSANAIRQAVADSTIAELQATQLSLDGIIAELQNKIKLLENDLAEKALVVSRLAADNAELEARVADLEEQLRTKVEAAEEHVVELNIDLDLQIAMVASLKLKLKAMQEQLEESAHSLVHETASLEQCQAELQAAQAALRQSQFTSDAKLASLVEEEASLQRANALLASQLNEKEKQAAANEAKVTTLTEQLNARQAELKRLDAELSGAAGASRQNLRDLEDKLRDAEEKLSALTADQAAQANYVSEVDAQRKALKAEVTGKSAEVLRLEGTLEKLQEECRDQAAQLAKLRVQFSAAQVRLEEEGHRRIRQLAAHEQRVSELEVAKVAADHVQQRYEAKISALTNELNASASGSGKKHERMSV